MRRMLAILPSLLILCSSAYASKVYDSDANGCTYAMHGGAGTVFELLRCDRIATNAPAVESLPAPVSLLKSYIHPKGFYDCATGASIQLEGITLRAGEFLSLAPNGTDYEVRMYRPGTGIACVRQSDLE